MSPILSAFKAIWNSAKQINFWGGGGGLYIGEKDKTIILYSLCLPSVGMHTLIHFVR
jgi:hypothetical protein